MLEVVIAQFGCKHSRHSVSFAGITQIRFAGSKAGAFLSALVLKAPLRNLFSG